MLILATVTIGVVYLGHRLTATQQYRRTALASGICASLLPLVYYKYGIFLYDNLSIIIPGLPAPALSDSAWPLLPVGISFFTFRAISYLVDVYRGTVRPADQSLDACLYVVFFPTLLAGPIDRAATFFQQLKQEVVFDSDRFKSGALLFLGGMVKKIIIADTLAKPVAYAFNDSQSFSGAALLLAVYCFTFQIYCDFSGYTDMARGTARILGIDVIENFQRPYFAASITEFWHRWHVSLSTWLRDYVYIPLGGSRCASGKMYRNLFVTMVVGGLWHGAQWTFVVWGALHGLLLVCHKGWCRLRFSLTGSSRVWRLVALLCTFHAVALGWVFFRADTLASALQVLSRIAQWAPGFGLPWLLPGILIPAFVVVEIIGSRRPLQQTLLQRPRLARFVLYGGFALMVSAMTAKPQAGFVYFAF